mmetsp:Transcript_10986/g.23266  ORF Transcript_10986/g.23266 Transcript_10986/m.23266 type:complete len:211 (+) Transcript_10986:201-833(+)|eukprot:CAMPEP_0201126716 /NCGR_PEP_ID=MMETSP0850-20130426/27126_1 /ASSEMBLY_ACC=CAM_ASM_000622 /TAXON_ID=183588 /ORGANISM="Pseudo-nitzschia fraudulenta, Strain WWA7" /LENGTH=210 /DNA_ID=CAMNT_0047395253 /DNA_START=186 /DNA_END=818 /DNA_ORIENTATION=+
MATRPPPKAPAFHPPPAPPQLFCGCGKMLAKSKMFKKLVHATFDHIDDNGNGVIEKDELYAGVLLMHIKLAKHAGPAACYPPTKKTCDHLVENANRDHSAGIDKTEFLWIAEVMAADLLSRVVVYYLVLTFAIPFVVGLIVTYGGIPTPSYWEKVLSTVVSWTTFFLAMPLVINFIDSRYSEDVWHKTVKTAIGSTHTEEARINTGYQYT